MCIRDRSFGQLAVFVAQSMQHLLHDTMSFRYSAKCMYSLLHADLHRRCHTTCARPSVQCYVSTFEKVLRHRAGRNRSHQGSLLLSATALMCTQDCRTSFHLSNRRQAKGQSTIQAGCYWMSAPLTGCDCCFLPLCFHQRRDRAGTAPHTATCQRHRHQWPWCGAHASAALEPSSKVADQHSCHPLPVSCNPHHVTAAVELQGMLMCYQLQGILNSLYNS